MNPDRPRQKKFRGAAAPLPPKFALHGTTFRHIFGFHLTLVRA